MVREIFSRLSGIVVVDTMDALRRPREGQGVRTVVVKTDSQDGSGKIFPQGVPQNDNGRCRYRRR
jgi:hypothetical protein